MRKLTTVLLAICFAMTTMAQTVGMSPFGYGAAATGGGNATPTLVKSASELTTALKASGSKVVIITQNITVTSCIKVKATNKTLMALPGVRLISLQQNKDNSGILYFSNGSSNLILRNLTFEGPGAYDCDGWDLLCFDGVTKAWVDHCDFQDGCDGNFDNKGNTDNVTVSWCRFRYLKAPKAGGSGGTDDHRFTNLLGSNSSDKPADGTYSMTWAYCWWDNGCRERMLRCRNASLHFLNCYWNSSVANYYIGPENADCRFDGCTFRGAPAKNKIFYQNYNGKNGALFTNCVSDKGVPANVTNRTVASISYAYNTLNAATAEAAIIDANCGAGATLQVSTGGQVSSGCSGSVVNTYTVTFNANGHGTAPAKQTINEGEHATAPTAPTASGYTFGGWYREAACTTAWNFASDVVTSNVTLYAKWTENTTPGPGPTPGEEACFTMTTPTEATYLSDMIVSGGTLTDAAAEAKALTVSNKGVTFTGGASRLQIDLTNAISAGMVISINYVSTSSDKTTGLAVLDENGGNAIISLSNIASKASGTAIYTFSASDATYIGKTRLLLSRNSGAGGCAVSEITITGCGSSESTCTDAQLAYTVEEVNRTMGDADFTNPLTNPSGLTISYSTSNAAVATVSTSGKVKLVGAGEVTITATAVEQTVGGKTYCEKSVSYDLDVAEGISECVLRYESNGGTGAAVEIVFLDGDEAPVEGCTFVAPANKVFNNWNTRADGTGESYAPGDEVKMYGNVTLYAQWIDKPQSSGDCAVQLFYCGTADASANANQSTLVSGITTGTKGAKGTLTIDGDVYTATAGAQISTSQAVGITIPAGNEGTLYVLAASTSTSPRQIQILDAQGELLASQETSSSNNTAKALTFAGLAAGSYQLKTVGGGSILCLVGIQLCPLQATAVIAAQSQRCQKVLINGHLQLIRNGIRYDATGRVVK